MGRSLVGKELGQGISQRKDSTYQGRFTDRYGKRITIYGKTVNDVRTKMRKAQNDNDIMKNVLTNKVTLDDWFKIWLETCKKNCRNSTKQTYIGHYNRIKKQLGWVQLSKLNLINIQEAINQLETDNQRKNTKKVLVDMLNKAIDSDLLINNPSKRVNTICTKDKKKERRVLTIRETELLLEEAKETFYFNLIVFALETGMRIGEIVGLNWEDIDFEKRCVYVRHTLCYFNKDGKYCFELHDTKTESGKRTIPLTKRAIATLKIQQMKKNYIENTGKAPMKGFENLVFVTKNNKPTTTFLVKQSLRSITKNILKRDPEFKSISPHVLRHTFATRAIEKNIAPKVLQRLMGHATLSITMDLYCHVTDDTIFEEMNKLENEYHDGLVI